MLTCFQILDLFKAHSQYLGFWVSKCCNDIISAADKERSVFIHHSSKEEAQNQGTV